MYVHALRLRSGFLGIAFAMTAPMALHAASVYNGYVVRNLVSDIPDLADFTDPHLEGAWGMTESAKSPFWISDAGTGLSTLYSTTGSPIPLVVTVPPAKGGTQGIPTGIVYNGTTGFALATGQPGVFIFATLDGTISGWNPNVNKSSAVVMVDNSSKSAVYTGLAMGTTGGNTYLYAANLAGSVDVFDSNFKQVSIAFSDPKIPAGYAPFNIQNLGGNLYVTYGQQNSGKNFVNTGAGLGYVDIFNPSGALMQQLVAGGAGSVLNAPWGLAMAPANFGMFANDLLVGNFGDGTINVFNPTTGANVGTLNDVYGSPIVITNLWALQVGNGASGGDSNAVYFTAGISGPDNGNHGLLGRVQAPPVLTAAMVLNGASFQPSLAPNTFATIAGANLSATTRSFTNEDILNNALPTDIDNVSVTVTGSGAGTLKAYVTYVSPTQLNVLLPVGTPTGSVTLQTYSSGLVSNEVTVQVAAVAPAFFMQSDGKHVLAFHGDGTLVGPTTTTGATPAAPGETVVLYGTGFGATNPAAPDGQVITKPLPLATTPTVTVGGGAAQVVYSDLTFAGVFQINITIPASASSGDQPVVATASTVLSPATAVITVK